MNVEAKSKLRAWMRAELDRMAPAVRAEFSSAVCERLSKQDIWASANRVLLYAPVGNELDLSRLIRLGLDQGKGIALPAFDGAAGIYVARAVRDPDSDLRAGRFGILEPTNGCPEVPLKQLDLILVPGVVFTLNGHRIGRGRGYYDRLLAQTTGAKCGIAFDEQIQPELPLEPHDVLMDFMLTPTRWFVCPEHQ